LGYGLDFFVVRCLFSPVGPFAIPLGIQCILLDLTSAILCLFFIFPHSNFVVGTWWLPFVMEIIKKFHSGLLQGIFQTVADSYCYFTDWTYFTGNKSSRVLYFSDDDQYNWGVQFHLFRCGLCGFTIFSKKKLTNTLKKVRNFQLE